jgi:cellulose biosynthesis protein BcsQ
MIKILSVTNVKGGVGKKHNGIVFASILAEENNVLLMDLDSQNSLSSFFYENYNNIENKTIYKVLLEKLDIKDTVKIIYNKFDFIQSIYL